MPDVFDQAATPADVFDEAASPPKTAEETAATVKADVFDKAAQPEVDDGLPSLRPAPEISAFQKIKQAIRERLTPLIGPSEEEVNREGVTVTGPNGQLQRVYKPGGDAIERLGLLGGLSQPAAAIPRATYDPNDPMYKALAKAGYNVAAGFGEFAESPLGLATAGLGSVAGVPAAGFREATTAEEAVAAARQLKTMVDLQKAVGAGYALDLASKVPEAARAAGELSAQPGLGPKAEAALQLATAIGLPAGLAVHAAPTRAAEMAAHLLNLGVAEGPTAPVGVSQKPQGISEFGGVADRAALVRTPTGEVSPISTKEGLDLTEQPNQEKGIANAIGLQREQEGVQPERENGNEGGQATEAGGGDRVLGGRGEEEVPPAATPAGALLEPPAGVQTELQALAQSGEPSVQTPGPEAGTGSTILADLTREASDQRQTIPASWVQDLVQQHGTWALPEGYTREGNEWVYREPEKGESEAQRMVRENQEAVAAIRGGVTREAGGAGQGATATERVEPGTPTAFKGERPPDILDWIGERFQRGVAMGSKADYGDYVANAKGRAKELLSLSRGEPADQVIKAMHEGGEYPRITTPDELATAMVRAGEARKGPSGRGPSGLASKEAPGPTVDDPWQATIDALNGLKVDTGRGIVGSFGLVPEAWNTLIEMAKLGVKAGKGISDAVDWAIDKFKEKGFGFGQAFDEKGAREHLISSLGERETGVKLQASGDVSQATKDAVTEYLYQTRSNASDQETADRLVQDYGVDQAERTLLNPPANMPGAVQSKLLGSVTRALAQSERMARANGDAAAAAQLAERQGKLWDAMLPRITEMAQSLQAMRDIIDVTPEGQVARVRTALERKAQEIINGTRKPEVEVMRGALEEGQRNGIEAVRQDPAVNGAARAAVNETVANSPETHRAVIMDLAEGWSESPVIVNQARELVRERAGQLLRQGPPPIGKTASEALRATMDDLGKRAASIAANYFQGVAGHRNGLAGLYEERLGLDEAHAKRLAARMDQEFARMVNEAKNKLPQRIANARVARERANGVLDLNAPTAAVDRAIRRQLQDLNLKLGDVMRQEAGKQGGTAGHVAERIVDASGLSGARADTLRNILKQRWDALVNQAQVSALEARQAASGVRLRGPMKDAFTKLAELSNMGALTGQRFLDVVKKAFNLRELTDADAQKLKGLVENAQRQPEGFLRQRAAASVLQETERLSGDRHWWDVPMAIWYTNAVSGFTTWAKIPFENANMYVANILAALTSRPGEALNPGRFLVDTAGALKRGLGKGALQAESTLRTGTVTGVWDRPKTNLLEGALGPKWDKVNFWKYLARVTSTAHEMTFKPAWELKQSMIARDVARREGLSGKALTQRVADLMGNTDEAVARARGQATQELSDLGRLTARQPGESAGAFAKRAAADKLDLARRTREIIEQERETKMPGSTEVARDYALRTTYLNEPYGVMGVLADGINAALRKVRMEAPLTGMALKTQVPFVRVASNILNEAWNWGPGGLQRAALSHWSGKLYGRPIMDRNERAEMYAKGMLGTAAVGALAAFAGGKIHGMGPSDPKRRSQLLAEGWIPYSFGPINGRYYSYDKTPLKLWGAVLGNYEDWRRYGKGDDADGATRLAFVTKASISTLLNQSMLESVKQALESLGDTSTGGGARKLEQTLARAGSTFVMPNLLQQLDRVWDPTVYDTQGVQALVKSQIPLVRRENRPVLNILGEPIQSGPFHYWTSTVSQDPVWRFLSEKGAFVPEPSKASIVGNKRAGEGQYRAITPDEYYDLVAKTGPQIKQAIKEAMPQMKDLDRKQTQDVVAMIANTFHQAYKEQLKP